MFHAFFFFFENFHSRIKRSVVVVIQFDLFFALMTTVNPNTKIKPCFFPFSQQGMTEGGLLVPLAPIPGGL